MRRFCFGALIVAFVANGLAMQFGARSAVETRLEWSSARAQFRLWRMLAPPEQKIIPTGCHVWFILSQKSDFVSSGNILIRMLKKRQK
jgi:hypothetical protein